MEPTIKVLEVIRQGQIGGGESHLLDLIAGFKETITPVVLAFTPGPMIETLRHKGMTCYVIPTLKPFDLKIEKQIEEIIRTENIQIVHAHGSRAASNMLWTVKRMKLPMVYTVHGWSFHQDQSFLVKTLRAWSEKLICRNSRKVICVSESNKETGKKVFGLKKAQVIENGINVGRFNPALSFKNVRKELGIPEKEIIVGFIGRITLQKAPLDLVKGIALAHQRNPLVKGLIVGEGDMKNEMIAYIDEHQLNGCFYLTDFRTDVPDLLNGMDIFCLPSLWEGLSIALLEAMAMEKALVVTPTDGTTELIKNGRNGIIVNFQAPEELADAITKFITDPEFKKNCECRARQLVEARFNSQRVSDEVTKIYQSLIV